MKRIVYLDNIKFSLIMLVLAHHLAIAFGGNGNWPYKILDPGHFQSVALTIFVAINQSFFMSLFFLISAYFSQGSYDKRGARVFLEHKLIRLGIPWLVYFIILSPIVAAWSSKLSGMPIRTPYSQGPVWFVMALLIFNLCYMVYRKINNSQESNKTELPSFVYLIIFCSLLGLITFLVRQLYPLGTNLLGFQLGYFPMYIMQFSAGILAAKNNWLRQLTARYATPWFLVSLACIVFIIVFIPYVLKNNLLALAIGGFNRYALILAVWESFACVSLIISSLSLFHVYANRSNSFTQALANSAYTVFIFQEFFIILITSLLVSAHLTGLVGWLLSCVVTIPLAFTVSYYFRKLPYVDRVL